MSFIFFNLCISKNDIGLKIHLFVFFNEHVFFVVLTFYACLFLGQYKEMRCLYSSQHFEEENLLQKHYENNHKVDINNWFLKLYLSKQKHIFLAESVIAAKAF